MKIKKLSLIFTLATACFWACKNDKSGNAESVQEIPLPLAGAGQNSSIVRNPVSADQPLDTAKMARIVFEQPDFDFGQANEGDVVEHAYKFKNTGAVPLLISNARASCGCTVPEWPKDPIPPGGTGEITAKFNTADRGGDQKKVITVTANSWPQEKEVVLHGFVKKKSGKK